MVQCVLKYQKRIIATDYPFFVVNLYEYEPGVRYSVELYKEDLGYVKKILAVEFTTPLESFVFFEKTVEECIEGKHNMHIPKEGEPFA